MNNELYLCEREFGLHPQRAFDIFYDDGPICNYQIRKLWDDKLVIHPLARYIDKGIELCPVFKAHRVNSTSRDRYGIFENCRPHLAFSKEEAELGRSNLEAIGVKNADYICVLCRDSAYLKSAFPKADFSYHSYRNVDISSYIPALEMLTDRGYYVLRMGSVVEKEINLSHPMVIEYASNGMRTEFLDIYLSANCRFFMSSGLGLDAVAKIFRRPILYTNIIPIEGIRGECSQDLCIPKKMWIRAERRFMTFREIIESGVGRFYYSLQFEKCGLEIIDNSSDEIYTAAVEMDERIKGTWSVSEEDEELQRRFWSLLKPNELNGIFLSRISAEFLRQNRKLLE